MLRMDITAAQNSTTDPFPDDKKHQLHGLDMITDNSGCSAQLMYRVSCVSRPSLGSNFLVPEKSHHQTCPGSDKLLVSCFSESLASRISLPLLRAVSVLVTPENDRVLLLLGPPFADPPLLLCLLVGRLDCRVNNHGCHAPLVKRRRESGWFRGVAYYGLGPRGHPDLLLGLGSLEERSVTCEHEDSIPLSTFASFISASATGGAGFGCATSSRSFAERRCSLAASTGPKTFFLSRWLLAFFELARALLAMVRRYEKWCDAADKLDKTLEDRGRQI